MFQAIRKAFTRTSLYPSSSSEDSKKARPCDAREPEEKAPLLKWIEAGRGTVRVEKHVWGRGEDGVVRREGGKEGR
jgi:hypothetical protein